ncbi:MAG TPA: RNA polymerase sigma factor [Gemmataceae bacterium]|nr:RNA polymerase sigma factor [Gemmataceae bacterium]
MRTLQALLNHTRRVLRLAPAGGSTDAQLLSRFQAGDDSAFELLVWRHGPMILNVCRRILNDEHAAEDAFQTTFLALAVKSGAIGRGDAVGAWLYRVAYRTALRSRLRAAKRKERERVAGLARAERTDDDPCCGMSWDELRPSLEAEVARLPVEYRTAFILCHLEGKTNAEAARELGCPVGTVQSRLSRARARLRSRLRKKGLGPDCIPFIFFIQRPQDLPEVPPALVYATVHAARPTLAFQTVAAVQPAPPVRRTGRWLRRTALTVLFLSPFAAAATLAYGVRWLPPYVPPPAASSAPQPPTAADCGLPPGGTGAACHPMHVGEP